LGKARAEPGSDYMPRKGQKKKINRACGKGEQSSRWGTWSTKKERGKKDTFRLRTKGKREETTLSVIERNVYFNDAERRRKRIAASRKKAST